MIALGERRKAGEWRQPIVKTVAARGEGVSEVVEALEKHRAYLAETGLLLTRRRARAAAEIEAIVFGVLRSRFGSVHGGPESPLRRLAERVAGGELDPFTAADQLIAAS
jgi:LAO/AO transport system kinase